MFKSIVQKYLEHLAKRYLKVQKPQVVAVVGSVGKTGTKVAIATVLSEKYRVRLHEGNHNTPMSVPLSILGVEYPDDVHSIKSWLDVFRAAKLRLKGDKDVDVIVQELGTDHPGDIKYFSRYLKPNIAVVTAVSDEHMEFFSDLTAVAKEELSIAGYSDFTVINRDDIDEHFAKLADTHNLTTYGLGQLAEYRLDLAESNPLDGRTGRIICPEWGEVPINLQLIGEHNAKAAAAAVAVAAKLGLTSQQTAVGVAKVKPTPGRMQLLRGLNDSILIDDTYNSSPLAAKAALETLYRIDAPQRIAILGSMNELGHLSAQAHEALGKLCDSSKLDWVVTIGEEAELYLVPAAKEKGCQVRSFKSAIDAGGFVHSVMKPGAVVLAKGSQNKIYAEEALKILLHNTEEEASLVRQSPAWLDKKQAYFSSL
ncbi:MAG TPA: UDP-N-acetylmuramoyl-tripeptide--D-alanyl-D-alanine ligase [Candidatus Saccharimonadales bacterium]|nr:UDP-N-acetylmuramoyl-tripeptide--D-alanyl-D-alanine ligase [Candidatus Saccharimonadales bacterium]